MTQSLDIAALAKLARLELAPEELTKLEKEIPEILSFVERIQSVGGTVATVTPTLRNVIRADENSHETGLYTRTLVDAAPAHKDDQISVKQVISK